MNANAHTWSGFDTRNVEVNGVVIHTRIGGAGPPLLLLHGYPQTHAMWSALAPSLARHFTVVCGDLRGYGDSSKPVGDARHENYSKRTMAQDQLELMRALGFARFRLAGHDRGARVAHRLCLDHTDAVERVAILDIVPTLHVFDTLDAHVAMAYFHWLFLAQDAPLPERMLRADPRGWLTGCLERWSRITGVFDESAVTQYVNAFSDPACMHATCEDYRAGATIDLEHDRADFGRRKVACPMLVLWGGRGLVGKRYDVLDVWRSYATDVRGEAIDCGHFLPEEAPAATLASLLAFFSAS